MTRLKRRRFVVAYLRTAVVATGDGPSLEELDEIEAELPLIEAEVAVTDAECQFLRYPSDLSAYRLAAAQREVLQAARQIARPVRVDRVEAA